MRRFHARGPSTGRSLRVEIWAYGRRSPFVPWAGLWFIVAVPSILMSPPQRWAKRVAVGATLLLLVWMGMRDARMLPNQPAREALVQADAMAPAGSGILIASLGAQDSADVYGNKVVRHELRVAPDAPSLLDEEQRIIDETGRKPWIVILYEDLARRRDHRPQVSNRGLWTHIIKNYQLVTRLDGRVSPVAIYAPRETPANVAVAR